MKRKFSRKYKIKRKEPFYKKKTFFLCLILIFLFFLGYFLLFSSFFQIREIKISGAEKIKEENIKNFLKLKTKKEILFWKTNSVFLIKFKDLQKEILENFPKIESVSLKVDFPNVLEVLIKERKGVALFFQENKFFLIDKSGIIFEKINNENFPQFFVIEKDKKEKVNLGNEVIEKEIMEKILEIEKELRSLNLEIEKVKIKSKERVNIKTKKGFEIYFSLKEKISDQIFYLDVVLKEKIPEEKLANLEYIDLRFGNRIYFKYKD